MTGHRSWSVAIDFVDVIAGQLTDDVIADLVDGLHAAGGVVATREDRPTWLSIRVTVEAPTAMAAVDEAMRAIGRAGVAVGLVNDLPADKIEVTSFETLEEELAQPAFPELLGNGEIAKLLGVSRQRASQITKNAAFPTPVAQLSTGPVWTAPSVSRFVEEWDRKPGRPPKVELPASLLIDEEEIESLREELAEVTDLIGRRRRKTSTAREKLNEFGRQRGTGRIHAHKSAAKRSTASTGKRSSSVAGKTIKATGGVKKKSVSPGSRKAAARKSTR